MRPPFNDLDTAGQKYAELYWYVPTSTWYDLVDLSTWYDLVDLHDPRTADNVWSGEICVPRLLRACLPGEICMTPLLNNNIRYLTLNDLV